MPLYKYVANRVLTLAQNLLLGYKLSEYHTGFRAFSKEVLVTLPLEENDEGFVFDNQMLAQAIYFGYHICEVTCPTRYHRDASSISFGPSVRYGFGVLATSVSLPGDSLAAYRFPNLLCGWTPLRGKLMLASASLALACYRAISRRI